MSAPPMLPLPLARRPVTGTQRVPASKSILQRALVLAALSESPVELDLGGASAEGEDVLALRAALERLGGWRSGALGGSRESLALDLGLGATGFRLVTALATLRPAGARTLVRGRPALLARPHHEIRRALSKLGAHVVRKASGAHRVIGGGVIGGGVRCGELSVSCRGSSQHLSALMLLAPRLGGLRITLADRPVSLPYVRVTAEVLARFGVPSRLEGLEAPGGLVEVPAGAPACVRLTVEPDASAAATWWAAAVLTGGDVTIAGLPGGSAQADMALLPVLERMGAKVTRRPDAGVRLEAPSGGLLAPGEVDLRDAPDLVPLVAVLAARARGTTRIHGVEHARGKESDRLAASAALLTGLGALASVEPDGVSIVGGAALHGGLVEAAGDHRIAFAAALLGLVVPGVVLRGAGSASKSHPGFLQELARVTGG